MYFIVMYFIVHAAFVRIKLMMISFVVKACYIKLLRADCG